MDNAYSPFQAQREKSNRRVAFLITICLLLLIVFILLYAFYIFYGAPAQGIGR